MLQLIQDQRLIGQVPSRTAARGFGRSSRGPSALQSPRPDGGRCSACDRRGCAPYFDRRSSGVNSNPARGSRHFSRNRRRLRRLRSNTEPHCILEHGGRRTNEAEQLLQSIEGQTQGLGQLRERAWMCNILARRYRLDGLLDNAVTVAQEAIDIGGRLGDPYVVALNRIGLGNALRAKGDLRAALEVLFSKNADAKPNSLSETR